MALEDEEVLDQEVDHKDELGEGFDDAWNEDEEQAAPTKSELDESEAEDELAQAEGDAPGEEAENDLAEEEEKNEKAEDLDNQENLDKSENADDADPEKVKQELKTWQGRTQKAKDENTEIEAKLEENRQKLEQINLLQDKTDENGNAEDLTEEEQETLDNLLEEYPELAKAVQILTKQTARKETKSVKESVSKTQETVDQMNQDAEDENFQVHTTAIIDKHSDFKDLVESGEVKEWVETLPHKEALEYLRVMENGNSAEVIGLLDSYKNSTQSNGEDNQDDDLSDDKESKTESRREKQRRSAEATRSRSGGPPQTIAKNDFDAGWEDAPD